MGDAEIQAIQEEVAADMGLVECCEAATADALCPLGVSLLNPGLTCRSRMTGDCRVRLRESREGVIPPGSHQTPKAS